MHNVERCRHRVNEYLGAIVLVHLQLTQPSVNYVQQDVNLHAVTVYITGFRWYPHACQRYRSLLWHEEFQAGIRLRVVDYRSNLGHAKLST